MKGKEVGDRLEEGVDLGGEIRARFTEEKLAAFVAENVSRDRGATSRLAEAFNALITSEDQAHTALLLAEERVSLSPLGSDPGSSCHGVSRSSWAFSAHV